MSELEKEEHKVLQLDIYSFSYKKNGIPTDDTDNGGGFVFDCRGILNPGRIDEYKTQSGLDEPVQTYLETQTAMPEFLALIKKLLDISIQDYIARGFSHLQISFGCTGGQHRSVYSALTIGKYLQEQYKDKVNVSIEHQGRPHWRKTL
jgi:RNase adaptor protein for sRNA GlmZ degradation